MCVNFPRGWKSSSSLLLLSLQPVDFACWVFFILNVYDEKEEEEESMQQKQKQSTAQHSAAAAQREPNYRFGPTAYCSLFSPAFSCLLLFFLSIDVNRPCANQSGRSPMKPERVYLSFRSSQILSLSLAHKRRLIILLIVEQTSEGKRRPLHSLNTCELTAEAAGAGLDSFLFGYKSPSFFFLLFLFFSLVTHWVSVPVILLFYWRPMMGQCLPCYCCAWSMRRRRNRCREARRGVRHGTARTGRNNPQRIKKHSSRNLAVIAIPNTAQLQTRGNKKQQNRKIKRRKAISCCNAMAKSLGTQKYEQRIILPLG